MDGKRFLRSIRLRNILSFGPDTPELPLEPLNVLIGPNASGKSNLIEALSVLGAAPRDLQTPIREGGGIQEWPWKGARRLGTAIVDVTMEYPAGKMPLRYSLSFTETASRFDLQDEALENERPFPGNPDPYFYYRYQDGRPAINVVTEAEVTRVDQIFGTGPRFERSLRREDVEPDQSILSQRRDPDSYPELTYVATRLERMRFYREWNLGRLTPPRLAQKADLPNHVLLEDASNLGLVLSDLLNRPDLKSQIVSRLQTFYSEVKDIVVNTTSGVVQVFFHESGLHHSVPATRLSDGTLRYLCLLVVLCHPEPPPVICLEEPELGLHPDIIPEVAKLLLEASTRTQLIVTTHSDILMDALSDTPEAVVVCEKVDGATQLQRLDSEQLQPWLAKYRLGDLWTRGDLGGTRW
jgi:predicted ATPase